MKYWESKEQKFLGEVVDKKLVPWEKYLKKVKNQAKLGKATNYGHLPFISFWLLLPKVNFSWGGWVLAVSSPRIGILLISPKFLGFLVLDCLVTYEGNQLWRLLY